MTAFRILIADDHEVVRLGIRSMLTARGWQVCGEAADGREAVYKTTRLEPDLVILDEGMPGLSGVEAARQILSNNGRQRILMLAGADLEPMMREALKAGVRGLILKSDPGDELVEAITALQQGRTFFTSRASNMVLDSFLHDNHDAASKGASRPGLTSREREITQLLSEGKSTKEVASILGVSVKTAETHRNNIMIKLKIHSTAELVLYAVRNNIVYLADPGWKLPVPPAPHTECAIPGQTKSPQAMSRDTHVRTTPGFPGSGPSQPRILKAYSQRDLPLCSEPSLLPEYLRGVSKR